MNVTLVLIQKKNTQKEKFYLLFNFIRNFV